MRELKFRAWYKQKKVMFTVHDLLLFDEGYGASLYRKSEKEEYIKKAYPSEIILRQYTGLKDKNGVEIYEEDVLEYDVLYNQKRKFVVQSIEDLYFNDQLDYVFSDCTIIGNIYENPELMEAEQ